MVLRNFTLFYFLALFLASAKSAYGGECESLPTGYKLLSGPYSIGEVESRNMVNLQTDSGEENFIPFGYFNKSWTVFKSKLTPNEKLWEYCFSSTSENHSYSEGGYLAIRGKCYLGKIVSHLT